MIIIKSHDFHNSIGTEGARKSTLMYPVEADTDDLENPTETIETQKPTIVIKDKKSLKPVSPLRISSAKCKEDKSGEGSCSSIRAYTFLVGLFMVLNQLKMDRAKKWHSDVSDLIPRGNGRLPLHPVQHFLLSLHHLHHLFLCGCRISY